MTPFERPALAVFLIISTPAAGLAQHGGGHPGGGSRGSAPAHPVAPANRVPQPHQAPPKAGGFDFNHDVNARPSPQHVPTTPIRHGNVPGRPVANFPHAPFAPGGAGPYNGRFHGPTIPNPQHWNGPWGWNHGHVWRPAPAYWGSGFWGPLSIAALAGVVLYGSIADEQNQVLYPSYEIEPDSPGAQLLQNYGLQQTPCGPPNLVVIWGPDNSVICAYPNDEVAPGNYELDPSTLTIVSESP